MNALVLAGGRRDGVCDGTNAVNKAFVAISGVTMVARVIAALRGTEGVERVIVVAPPEALQDEALLLADERRPSGEEIVDSLTIGIDGLDPDARILLATSDAPLLEPRALERFLADVKLRDPDLAYAIVERREHEARFPGVPHTWARMRGGVYCGGAIFALRPRVVPQLARFLGRLANARKRPLALASLFGWDVLARFALGMLTVAAAERRAAELLGSPVVAIPSAPELAFNVDRKTDLPLAERYLTSSA